MLAVLFLLVLLAHAVFEREPITWEGAGVGAISLWVVASLAAAAWRWERWGGLSGLLAGIALGVFVIFTAARNQVPVALALGGPVALTGLAFLLANRAPPATGRSDTGAVELESAKPVA